MRPIVVLAASVCLTCSSQPATLVIIPPAQFNLPDILEPQQPVDAGSTNPIVLDNGKCFDSDGSEIACPQYGVIMDEVGVENAVNSANDARRLWMYAKSNTALLKSEHRTLEAQSDWIRSEVPKLATNQSDSLMIAAVAAGVGFVAAVGSFAVFIAVSSVARQ